MSVLSLPDWAAIRELHDALIAFGHAPEDLRFILSAEKVLPPEGGRNQQQAWQRDDKPERK